MRGTAELIETLAPTPRRLLTVDVQRFRHDWRLCTPMIYKELRSRRRVKTGSASERRRAFYIIQGGESLLRSTVRLRRRLECRSE